MSKDILPSDWINRFFNSGFGNPWGRRGSRLLDRDLFEDFNSIHEEMNRMFDVFNNFTSNAPKELVREYETKEGNKVREVGPIVYGYSMTIGPDGKPQVREFGNVKSIGKSNIKNIAGHLDQSSSQISLEREPLVDVNTTDKEIKVVVEMPGIKKADIQIKAYDSQVEVTTSKTAQRKYHKNIDLPEEADIETARSVYNNGILEITFDKKKVNKPTGKEIKID
jgi:HSP20 family protein